MTLVISYSSSSPASGIAGTPDTMPWPGRCWEHGVVSGAAEDGYTLQAYSIQKLSPLRTMPSLHVGLQGLLQMLTGTTWDYQLSDTFDTTKIQRK